MSVGLFVNLKCKTSQSLPRVEPAFGWLWVPWLVVAGWRLWIIASQHHLLAVASEVGSIPQFRERLFASSDGSSLVYYRETENGLGTYFYDTASGKSRMLFQQREFGFDGFLGTVAWSPDNRLLACAYKNDTDPQHPKTGN